MSGGISVSQCLKYTITRQAQMESAGLGPRFLPLLSRGSPTQTLITHT